MERIVNPTTPISVRHWIGGERRGACGGEVRRNPSNLDEVVAEFPTAEAQDVADAVSAARAAFPGWSQASPEVRGDVLDRAGGLLFERREAIGRLLAREEGKTLAEGVGETTRAARILKFFAGEALRLHGQSLMSTRPGVEVQTHREPLGVFGLITPWNFPIAIPAWKIAPAIAFGNCVVLKPAAQTPATAQALVDILHEAGAPAGVVNMVIGGADAGAALVADPGVEGISFTGSQRTGAAIARVASTRQARLQMEMGGKNPLIILDDADLERAVACALDGAYFSSGQRCTASSRLIVQSGVHDRFLGALQQRLAGCRVGDALDPATTIGPQVSEAQRNISLDYIALAMEQGGRLVFGGDRNAVPDNGWYVQPALIADTAPHMRINQEEVFGPVAAVIRVDSYEEALAIANGVEQGLSAGIVTASLKHARDFQRRARAGMTMINLPTAGVDYHVPFGGVKSSSFGPREQGFAAADFYTSSKTSYSCS